MKRYTVIKPIPGMGYQVGEVGDFGGKEEKELTEGGYIEFSSQPETAAKKTEAPKKVVTETAEMPKAETATATKKK